MTRQPPRKSAWGNAVKENILVAADEVTHRNKYESGISESNSTLHAYPRVANQAGSFFSLKEPKTFEERPDSYFCEGLAKN